MSFWIRLHINLKRNFANCLVMSKKSFCQRLIQAFRNQFYKEKEKVESIFLRLLCIGFYELIWRYYPQLTDLPRIFIWGEAVTAQYFQKHNMKLLPERQKLVDLVNRMKEIKKTIVQENLEIRIARNFLINNRHSKYPERLPKCSSSR